MISYIKRFYDEEIWKQVELKSPFAEKYELYVSNYGNIKRITLETRFERILSPKLTEGYPSINISLITPITKKESEKFLPAQQEIAALKLEIKSYKSELDNLDVKNKRYKSILNKIAETELLLDKVRLIYKKKYQKAERKRKKTVGNLVHRYVAIYFVEKPSEEHNLVAHIDYDKLNNHHSNLKWMTREENSLHQKNSPYVIKSKAKVLINGGHRANTKLTVNQVMIIKKRINEGVSLRELAKRTKVTETQLLRIKRGINWGKVPAAL
ncbi:HNH endonuclease [Flavobacterium sp.]|uniref:HNH endonuclease n=1 Tax=Flavobacterium sp. TaxID=239 RepID=UPI0038FCB49D